MIGELLLALGVFTMIYAVVVVILCTYMIKDGLRMRKERKQIERRLHGL